MIVSPIVAASPAQNNRLICIPLASPLYTVYLLLICYKIILRPFSLFCLKKIIAEHSCLGSD